MFFHQNKPLNQSFLHAIMNFQYRNQRNIFAAESDAFTTLSLGHKNRLTLIRITFLFFTRFCFIIFFS